MKAETIVKGYGLQGVTLELANVAVPADFTALKKVERELADAVLADKRASYEENGLRVPEMKRRVANIKRSSNYLDCYLPPAKRVAQPRGVILSYPNKDDGFGRWHGSRWTTDDRIEFHIAINLARQAVVRHKTEGWSIRETQFALVKIGDRWNRTVQGLVERLGARVE